MIDLHICDINLIYFSVVLLILAFWLWLEPVKRGFFCLDQALWYSFRDSTIQTWMLILIGVIPAILVSRNRRDKQKVFRN